MIWKRLAIISLASVFFTALIANVGIELNYSGSMPQTPQANLGRLIRLTINHGSVIYVNEAELSRFHFVQAASWCAMLATVVGIGILKLVYQDIWN